MTAKALRRVLVCAVRKEEKERTESRSSRPLQLTLTHANMPVFLPEIPGSNVIGALVP